MKIKNSIFILIIFFLTLDIARSQTYLEKKEFNSILQLYQQKKYKKALGNLAKFKDKYPSSYYLPEVYYYMAILEEDYYSSILMFKELVVKFPDYGRVDEALYRLGKIYFLHNNYSQAIRTFELLFEKYPRSDFLYGSTYWLGIVYLVKGNFMEADDFFNRVIEYKKKDKFHVLALIGRGNVQFEKQKYKKSVDLYKEALELKQKNYFPQIYLGLGNANLKLKQYDKAHYYFKKIMKEFTGTPEYEIAWSKIEFLESNKTIFDQIKSERVLPHKEKEKRTFYSVQVASVKNKRYANDLRIKLKVQGFESFMDDIETDKGKFYRTLVGKCKSKLKAQGIMDQINHKLKIKGIIIKIEL
ncbi:MAG: tetratricopeptide repeat protein [Spirochaetes bacterium]|nr:tetratricopeptide repeat protein [Spirochaetota bacterium]